MAVTYEAINTFTVSTPSSDITLSSIPSTFTDIVLICSVSSNRANNLDSLAIRFNSDTGSNYSYTYIYGDGSSASSGRASNQSNIWVGNFTANNLSSNFSVNRIQIQNYANTTTYKTAISRGGSNATIGDTNANVGLWRSTSAINSVTVRSETGNAFLAGSTFTLYGIKAA
jgi:hypothetical protein